MQPIKITKAMRTLLVSTILVLITATGNSQASQSNNATPDNKGFITLSKNSLNQFNQSKFLIGSSVTQPKLISASGEIVIAEVNAEQLSSLSEYFHQVEKRCGGYFYFDSAADAQAFSQQSQSGLSPSAQIPLPLSAPTLASVAGWTIDNQSLVNQMMGLISETEIRNTISTLAAYQNRWYQSSYGQQSNQWIYDSWSSLASSRSDMSVAYDNSCTNCGIQKNVVLTITGQTTPDEIVVIGAHQDSTIGWSTGNESRAPGADDDASGIATITETIRAAVSQNYKPQKTIKFIAYAAEEVGLRGSNAIAQSYVNQGLNVVAVAQFDMTNYTTPSAHDIWLMTDYSNAQLVDYLESLFNEYLKPTGLTLGRTACGYGCSDHASWNSQGVPAAMYSETSFNDINPNLHTSNDTLDAMGGTAAHSVHFAKLATAFMVEVAKDSAAPPPPPADNSLQNGVAKSNLSAATGESLLFTFEVPQGASSVQMAISGGSGDADLYTRFGAEPTDSTYDCRPYKNGNNETCTGSQSGGIYYVRVKGYSAYSGLTLVGTYVEGGGGGGLDPIEQTYNNVSVSSGQWARYSLDLPAGYSQLSVSISGGSGDADLYVRRGAQSTTSQYDCRPYKNGNTESCSFNSPAADQWYFDIRGYSAASGVTLQIVATP